MSYCILSLLQISNADAPNSTQVVDDSSDEQKDRIFRDKHAKTSQSDSDSSVNKDNVGTVDDGQDEDGGADDGGPANNAEEKEEADDHSKCSLELSPYTSSSIAETALP